MSESEPSPGTPATPPSAPAATPAAKPSPRQLPELADIAAWVGGDEVPTVGALFAGLNVAKFDILVLQIRKEELLPQHWQVIADHSVRDDEEFERLAEVGRLRVRYKDQELSRRRLAALKAGWRELRGKRPTLWSAADLFAALRRLLEKKVDVDVYELLSAVRDVWSGMTLPFGREQLEILWACLALVRQKTKK